MLILPLFYIEINTSIPTIAKRIAEQDEEYWEIKTKIERFARENNYPVEDVRLKGVDYPEDIEW